MPQPKGSHIENLRPRNIHRTVQSNCTEFLEPDEIYALITDERCQYPYEGGWFRGGKPEKYWARDKALMALMFLTSGRINEVLRLRKRQFKLMTEIERYKDKNPDPDILVVTDFWVSKRRGRHERTVKVLNRETGMIEKIKTGEIVPAKPHPIKDIPLSRVGALGKFTKLVEDYLPYLGKDDLLFDISKSRAWVIVNYITSGVDEHGNPVGGYERDMDGNSIGKPLGYWCHWFRAQSLSYLVNLLKDPTNLAQERGIESEETVAHYYKGDWLLYKETLKK